MALVKNSHITKKIEDSINHVKSQSEIIDCGSLFTIDDLMQCQRKTILQRKDGVQKRTKEPSNKWRYFFHSSDSFEVVSEYRDLADSETIMKGRVDMVVRYMGQLVLVNFYHKEDNIDKPSRRDILEMVVNIYLSGVSSAIIFYYNGDQFKSHFVNPDRKEYRNVLSFIINKTKYLQNHVINSTLPDMEAGEKCLSCEVSGLCNGVEPGVDGGYVNERKEGNGEDRG